MPSAQQTEKAEEDMTRGKSGGGGRRKEELEAGEMSRWGSREWKDGRKE